MMFSRLRYSTWISICCAARMAASENSATGTFWIYAVNKRLRGRQSATRAWHIGQRLPRHSPAVFLDFARRPAALGDVPHRFPVRGLQLSGVLQRASEAQFRKSDCNEHAVQSRAPAVGGAGQPPSARAALQARHSDRAYPSRPLTDEIRIRHAERV